ncbi:MAG: FecR domain-containing protein [Bacteroidota bacterium]
MEKRTLKQLLKKYERGECSEKEHQLLHDLYQSFQDDLPQNRWVPDHVGDSIFTNIEQKAGVKGAFPIGRVAASVIFILGICLSVVVYLNPSNVPAGEISHATAKGQKKTIVLPEGSTVRLNSESTITYSENFVQNRQVVLTGEAFFNVKRKMEKPFTVKSGEVQTTVLGTSFNVDNSDDHTVAVTVASGKVRVESNVQVVHLVPGEQGVYTRKLGKLTASKVNVETYTGWKDGILEFKGSTLTEVAGKLEKWYGVRILFESKQSGLCQLKLKFRNQNLKQVLDQLAVVTGVSYQFEKMDQVKIIGIGCKAQ